VQRLKRLAGKLKPLPFTEEQIGVRAYEVWEKRGQQGTPEENWQAAIAALRRERAPLWKLRHTWQTATDKDNRDFTLEVFRVGISAFGVLATIFAGVGLYLTYQNSQAERQLNTERLTTDRFSKAVEQLGSQDIQVRLGAIYSLERIAKDSPKDHWTVMEVLTAFVRGKSPLPEGWAKTPIEKRKLLPKVTMDVQSALTVIGRREVENDPERKQLDLSNSILNGADLYRANFSGAYFFGSDLYRVYLRGANLSGAILADAILASADFVDADLSGADFGGANLSSANLAGANLKDANFMGTHVINFIAGDVRHSTYNITPEQIKQAKNWQNASYEGYFSKNLGLLP